MPATPRTSFPGSDVQSRPEKLGGHLPIERGGRPDELIDRGERPRDVLRRKAVAQPLTSAINLRYGAYVTNGCRASRTFGKRRRRTRRDRRTGSRHRKGSSMLGLARF